MTDSLKVDEPPAKAAKPTLRLRAGHVLKSTSNRARGTGRRGRCRKHDAAASVGAKAPARAGRLGPTGPDRLRRRLRGLATSHHTAGAECARTLHRPAPVGGRGRWRDTGLVRRRAHCRPDRRARAAGQHAGDRARHGRHLEGQAGRPARGCARTRCALCRPGFGAAGRRTGTLGALHGRRRARVRAVGESLRSRARSPRRGDGRRRPADRAPARCADVPLECRPRGGPIPGAGAGRRPGDAGLGLLHARLHAGELRRRAGPVRAGRGPGPPLGHRTGAGSP